MGRGYPSHSGEGGREVAGWGLAASVLIGPGELNATTIGHRDPHPAGPLAKRLAGRPPSPMGEGSVPLLEGREPARGIAPG